MIENIQIESVTALIVGAGPAGLMAAEQLADAGVDVMICDAMPSFARKFLRAGVGGLNLTHSEQKQQFLSHYRGSVNAADWVGGFDAQDVENWVNALGIETFTGSSGRVFPVQKKASPLLRAWLNRLREMGVVMESRHRWQGWLNPASASATDAWRIHRFETPAGERLIRAKVCVLALGGGSWARLGSDGQWQTWLAAHGVECAPFKPANCGFDYHWSEHFLARFGGEPLKAVRLVVEDGDGIFSRKGEALLSRNGIEGGLIYQVSATLRELIDMQGEVTLYWDLLPDSSSDAVRRALEAPRGKTSMSNFLRKRLRLSSLKVSLLRELAPEAFPRAGDLALAIKRLPMTLRSARPLDEAISTAGGVVSWALTDDLMLKRHAGVYCAGEMLDWEAPTGGYLLTAVFASGRRAGAGAVEYLRAGPARAPE
tara:strand:- start:9208 stop:10491 length:1284 start_codon:yes stop_codon:yes gene_type:complete